MQVKKRYDSHRKLSRSSIPPLFCGVHCPGQSGGHFMQASDHFNKRGSGGLMAVVLYELPPRNSSHQSRCGELLL